MAGQLGIELSFEAAAEPFLHPGRSARVVIAGESVGWIGEVHPLVCRPGILRPRSASKSSWRALVAAASAGMEAFEDVTTFPAVHRDLAVVVPVEIPAAEVRRRYLRAGGELLRSAEIFDLYEGEQLGGGRKSLALRLEFRADDRTLSEEEVVELRNAIVEHIKALGGEIRARNT